jgi:hypothetical protein
MMGAFHPAPPSGANVEVAIRPGAPETVSGVYCFEMACHLRRPLTSSLSSPQASMIDGRSTLSIGVATNKKGPTSHRPALTDGLQTVTRVAIMPDTHKDRGTL